MNSIKNQVQVIGHLGNDPELITFENKNKMVRFNLATNESYKDTDGEKKTITQWHNIVAWGKTAEHINLMATKGSELAIQGKIIYRSYTDKNGVEKYITEIVAQEFLKLDRKEN